MKTYLINVPCLKLLGGVANHYNGLKSFWTENVVYNIVGRRSTRWFSPYIWFIPDVIVFVCKILFIRPDVIVLNPSLNHSAIKRDRFYAGICKLMGRNFILFIHGWNDTYYSQLRYKDIAFFDKASLILVLSSSFMKSLRELGVRTSMEQVTTKVDDSLLRTYSISERCYPLPHEKITLLFLARVEKEKGIIEVLDVYQKLKALYPLLSLRVVGGGSYLSLAREIVKSNGLRDILFTGNLPPELLVEHFATSDIYLFPSYHGEGLPTSLLEAMAFGLPVITTLVGGIHDFFVDGVMGLSLDSVQETEIFQKVRILLDDKSLRRRCSLYNYDYSKTHFLASKVVIQLQTIINYYIDSVQR